MLRNMRRGKTHSEASPLSDKIVFSKVKQCLGGNVRIILSGAAPLAPHVEAYLKVVACSHVLQGYGLTETCVRSFVSHPKEMDMLGTVGPPVPNLDARLESVPEMNYDACSSKPQGEICIRGDVLFSGYYKREDLTNMVGDMISHRLGRYAVESYLEQILSHGFFHADPVLWAAMGGAHVGAKQEDFLYDHFNEMDDFWFDFIADTGDGGNSS